MFVYIAAAMKLMENFRSAVEAIFCAVVLSCTYYPDYPHSFGPSRAQAVSSGSRADGSVKKPYSGAIACSMLLFEPLYDWVRDTAYGVAPVSVAVYEGTKRRLLLEGVLGADPDMHRIRGGRLYSDYCTGNETVVLCDGKEVFRYPGRESIEGFELVSGSVHTLGRNRSGEGFSYRIDGREQLSRPSGSIVSGLHEDGGTLWFSFRSRDVETGQMRYYLSDGKKTEEAVSAKKLSSVFSLRMVGGVPVTSGRMDGSRKNPVAYSGDTQILLGRNPPGEAISCAHVAFEGSEMVFCGSYRTSAGGEIYALWNRKGPLVTFPEGDVVHAVFPTGKDCLVVRSSGGRLILREGKGVDRDIGPYRLMTPSCAAYREGSLLLGLTGEDGCGLWHDGVFYRVPGNGFISGVELPSVVP